MVSDATSSAPGAPAEPRPAIGLPDAPPGALDPYLDAAVRCFARHGIRRTSVQDVARELGVDRTTVYRQVGTVEQQVRLVIARDLHRLLAVLPADVSSITGVATVVELLDAAVTFARAHPVLAKVLAHEPELLGPFLVSDLPALVGRIADVLAPLLDAAMAQDRLARRDPVVIAEWLVRVAVSLVLAPPPGDTRTFLAEVLEPALAPASPR